MTQKKTHQSKKANGVTKAATVRLANGLTGGNIAPISVREQAEPLLLVLPGRGVL